MELTTDAIDSNGFFDPRYTCDFDNSSPELRWAEPPSEIAGYALTAEDLDAKDGTRNFTHWVIYNISRDLLHLPTGIPPQDSLPNGIKQGVNSFGKLGYSGPCPAPGDRPHRYFFRLYALRFLPELPSRITRDQLLDAIQPHIAGTAEIMGRYQRAVQRAG